MERHGGRRTFDNVTKACKTALFTILAIALAVLIGGWAGRVTFFIRVMPDFAAMVPVTAISFLLIASSLLLLIGNVPRNISRPCVITASCIVAVIAIIDLILLVSGTASGISSILWPGLLDRPEDGMAAATAILFLFAALCSLHLVWQSRRTGVPFVVIATLGLILCSVALVAYALDTEALYQVFIFTAMALHTAIAFALLFLTLMLLDRRHGWIWLLLGKRRGSKGARRLFPFVVAVPLIFAIAALAATEAGLFSENFRLALLAISMMIIAFAAILRNAEIENRGESKLFETMAELEVALDDKSLLLREVYHRVKNNLQQINAMISIEMRNMSDPEGRAAFKAMASRIHALGTVHQLLIQSSSPSEVSVRTFLDNLRTNMSAGHGLRTRNIEVSVEANDDILYLDIAISMGLLVNELVANAVEHAFPNEQAGEIAIAFRDDGADHKLLTVTDNGVGFDPKKQKNMGSRIVRSLVGQLKGEMDVQSSDGTKISIRFPASVNTEGRYHG